MSAQYYVRHNTVAEAFFFEEKTFFRRGFGTRSKKGRSLVLFQFIHLGLQLFQPLLLPCKLFLPFRFRSVRSVRSLLLHDAFGFLRAVCEFVHDGYAVYLAVQDDKKVEGERQCNDGEQDRIILRSRRLPLYLRSPWAGIFI